MLIIMHYYFNLIFTMQTYKELMILFFCVFECIFPVVLEKSFLVLGFWRAWYSFSIFRQSVLTVKS